MRRLAVIGCALLGLLMPGGLTQAAGRKVKQGLRPVEADVEFEGSPDYEPDCGCEYAPEPSGDYAPEPGCGRRYAPEPSCNCSSAPGPYCGGGSGQLDSGPGLCGLFDGLMGDMWGESDSGCDCGGGTCGGGTCGCFEPCVHSSGIWIAAEVLWFRYHRADGVRVGTNEEGDDVEFDFEITPRLTAGWVRSDGLGGRARYWEFNHSAPAFEGGASLMNVDTYTFDVEVFDTFCLNRNWDLEIAAGARYTDFLEEMFDDIGDNDVRLNSFKGYGGLVGVELRRCVGVSGAVWLRTRGAILMADKDVANDPGQGQQVRLLDVTVGMMEVAFGYNYVLPMSHGSYAFVGVQAEWQNWYNFSSSFEDTENDEDFSAPSDVGFGGFGAVVGWAR